MTTAVDKWPAYSKLLAVLLAVAPAGHLPTAPTPRTGTRPKQTAPRLAIPGRFFLPDRGLRMWFRLVVVAT